MNGLKLPEKANPESKPFEECKLGRMQYAEILTDIIDAYPKGFVLAINNEWGTGKTFFLTEWKKFLEQKDVKDERDTNVKRVFRGGHKVIYFNAWENDFDSNPFAAMLGELKLITEDDRLIAPLIEKAKIFGKALAVSTAKEIIAKVTSHEYINNVNVSIKNDLEDSIDREIQLYTEKKGAILVFQEELKIYINKLRMKNDNKPLVFIIDELDRCRPSYAVEVLERIKHFFSVEGIVFVLSIDKEQLKHAIAGVYGSDKIDGEEYLRRFIDLEYSIPEPAPEMFVRYLYKYFEFIDFFEKLKKQKQKYWESINNENNQNNDKSNKTINPQYYISIKQAPISSANVEMYSTIKVQLSNLELIVETCIALLGENNITLRQLEKIFAHTKLVLVSLNIENIVFSEIVLFLVYLKIIDYNEYKNIETGNLKLADLDKLFSRCFKAGYFQESKNSEDVSSGDEFDIYLSYLRLYLLLLYQGHQESLGIKTEITVYANVENPKWYVIRIGNKNAFFTIEGIPESKKNWFLRFDTLIQKINLLDSMNFISDVEDVI